MNNYIQKIIKEQFNIANMDFNKQRKSHNMNIFNKVLPELIIYNKIINNEDISEDDFSYMNTLTSVIKPKDNIELKKIVDYYSNADNYMDSLNWLDVSDIRNMSYVFFESVYNGDISKWDVSNVTDMSYMFAFSYCYDINISEWDVSNVNNMSYMFANIEYNPDILKWDVSHVMNMSYMFLNSNFSRDISHWNVSNVLHYDGIFTMCQIPYEYKPKKFR